MKQILKVKSGALTEKEIQSLRDANYIVIISDDVDVIVTDVTQLAKDVALEVLYSASVSTNALYMREWFSKILMQRMGVNDLSK